MSNYSETISAQEYIESMARHLYLPQSDFLLRNAIVEYCQRNNIYNIVELGCGPGRVTGFVAEELLKFRKDLRITGVDIDPNFVEFARQNNSYPNYVSYVCEDLGTSQAVKNAQILFSQGCNHHIAGQDISAFCESAAEEYFISDEFLPEYDLENERKIRCLVWYSTVINDANKKLSRFTISQNDFEVKLLNVLIDAEIETILADLFQGEITINYDSEFRSWFLYLIPSILERRLESKFLNDLLEQIKYKLSVTESQKISKGDSKISLEVLRFRAESLGLNMKVVKTIGDLQNIGGFATVLLTKN